MRLNWTKGSIHDLVRDRRWSGSGLGLEIRRRSQVLRQFCRSRENRFLIVHGDSLDFFADLFAVWETGSCAVCANPNLVDDEVANLVEFVQPNAVLTGGNNISVRGVPVLCAAEEFAVRKAAGAAGAQLDDPALILFTSGTTGDPKGVVHTYRSVFSRLALNQAYIGQSALARSLCVLPTHFGHGLIGNCLTPLHAGGDLYLMRSGELRDTADLGRVIDRYDIRFLSSVPSFWKLALRIAQPPQAGHLQRIHIGSAPLAANLWRQVIQWGGTDSVANMYGITETANWVGGASSHSFEPEDGLLGKVWGGHFAVLGDDGSPAASGEGEILLQVPSLMAGYYRQPELTRDVLQNGWYFTGDTGRIDESGVLRMTGRNRYVINCAGLKIYPEELDLLLERHPEVDEACAFAIEDPVSGESPAVAVSLSHNSILNGQRLIEWTRQRIRPEAVPNRVFFVSDLPKTERGKLNRQRVAEFCLGQQGSP